ncbi:phosphotransferase family protein [Paenibacillus sp. 32352]|uniref:phosphotransferase family protein n=1 Tax=Paenibacillus sp. 32352 TaxID=1969111 RepID=UPI0009ACD6D5|nr:phosphotransferase [Paenibacillus sp. 32352]
MPPISGQEIPFEIRAKLGNINGITFPRQGYTSDVGIIDARHGKAVLKRARGKQYSEWLEREASVLSCLASTGLRVPKVYHFMQAGEQEGIQCWLLMEYLQGETLRSALTYEKDSARRYDIIYAYGRILQKIHSTPCPDELKKSEIWLDAMLTQAEYHLKHYQVDGTPALLEKIRYQRPKEMEQTLIHGDFTIDNVLVHEGSVAGIIDWSGGAYGDPRYDVSLAVRPKPNIFQSSHDQRAFFDGYGAKIITDEDYDYFVEGLNSFF